MRAATGRGGRARRPLVHRGEELRCTLRLETEAARAGYEVVAGLDEVGRGALCGPVVACAVVLGPGFDPSGIDDSKRLTPLQRERLADRIRAQCAALGLASASPAEIDRLNILRATHLAMRRALAGLPAPPDLILVDGLEVPGLGPAQWAIVKGDALSVSIASASIVAKVARDAMMRAWDERLPGYGLGHNMGYASEDHREALRRLGPSPIHRRSFAAMLQRWLF
jgi:ribonuclease HII